MFFWILARLLAHNDFLYHFTRSAIILVLTPLLSLYLQNPSKFYYNTFFLYSLTYSKILLHPTKVVLQIDFYTFKKCSTRTYLTNDSIHFFTQVHLRQTIKRTQLFVNCLDKKLQKWIYHLSIKYCLSVLIKLTYWIELQSRLALEIPSVCVYSYYYY